MSDQSLSRPIHEKTAEAQHRWLVAALDDNPKYGWPDAPPTGAFLVRQLRPMLYELWATDQVTEEGILSVFESLGYPISSATFWKVMFDGKPNKVRRSPPRVRPLGARRFDMMVLRVGEALGTERLDPRVRLRYLELTGGLPSGVGSGVSLLLEAQRLLLA